MLDYYNVNLFFKPFIIFILRILHKFYISVYNMYPRIFFYLIPFGVAYHPFRMVPTQIMTWVYETIHIL